MPIFMCVLNARTRILIFKILTPSVPQTTEEMMSKFGFEIGGQLPFAGQFQKLVWEDDDLETLEREFHTMVAKIEKVKDSTNLSPVQQESHEQPPKK